MTPRVNELEALITAVKKALRAYRGMRGVPDGPASDDLVEKAKALGLVVHIGSSLQELLEQAQALIQTEVLREFDRWGDETRH